MPALFLLDGTDVVGEQHEPSLNSDAMLHGPSRVSVQSLAPHRHLSIAMGADGLCSVDHLHGRNVGEISPGMFRELRQISRLRAHES